MLLALFGLYALLISIGIKKKLTFFLITIKKEVVFFEEREVRGRSICSCLRRQKERMDFV